MINKSYKPFRKDEGKSSARPRNASTGVAYAPKNSSDAKPFARSSARPGSRSARPASSSSSRPFTRDAGAKKPRWVPRPGATGAPARSFSKPTTGASRPYTPRTGGSTPSPRPYTPRASSDAQAPALFPQKPPYRPSGGVAETRPLFVRRAPATSAPKARYGFLPKDDKKGAFERKPFEKRDKKPFGNSKSDKPRFTPKPKPSKTQLATTSWGGVAEWYDKHLEGTDTYHEKVILPNLVRLVEAKKGEHILDLASGQGVFSRKLAGSGATLTGIDISPELIAIAKKTGDEKIEYHVGSAEKLSMLKDATFDKTLIVLAIQNIEHVQSVCSEAARVTKVGGTFHIVMNHPAFRIPKQSSWAYDEKEKLQYRRTDQYLSESRTEIEMHPGMKDSPRTVSFHRPLQYYIKALAKAGFAVDRFEEWISHKDSDSGPRAKAENHARKEIPLFLYLRAKKI